MASISTSKVRVWRLVLQYSQRQTRVMTAGMANQEIGEKGAVQAGQRGTSGLRNMGRLSASQFIVTPKDQPRIAIAIIMVTDYTYSLEYRRGYGLRAMPGRSITFQ